MSTRPAQSWLLGIFLTPLVGMAAAAIAAEPPRPLPISAHNCYAPNRTDNPRLAEALSLGVDNIEIDLGWDAATKRLIVGHDAAPRPGVAYPRIETSLIPALEACWKSPRPDGAPTVLTIDWKTGEPEAVRRFKDVLDARPDWFSSAPKAVDSPLTTRRLTVCFSGDDAAKEAYDAMILRGGTYRAFRDRVIGAGAKYQEEVADYVPESATPYHRFLAFHWGAVERGGPALAGEWTPADEARLRTLADLVHRRGFRVRLYSLNGHTGPILGGYRFVNDEAAQVRWKAAAAAGIDWIAGDEYREMVETLGVAVPGPARP